MPTQIWDKNLKLEIQGPSQVSTLFTSWLSLLVPTHGYSSQEPACLGRPNFPVSGRKNSSVFLWPHLASFLPAHSAALGQVAFKLHIPSPLPGTCPPPIGPEAFSPSFPCSDSRCDWDQRWDGGWVCEERVKVKLHAVKKKKSSKVSLRTSAKVLTTVKDKQ